MREESLRTPRLSYLCGRRRQERTEDGVFSLNQGSMDGHETAQFAEEDGTGCAQGLIVLDVETFQQPNRR
jgi:hypothetical protein